MKNYFDLTAIIKLKIGNRPWQPYPCIQNPHRQTCKKYLWILLFMFIQNYQQDELKLYCTCLPDR